LRVRAEVGIAFIMREILIDRYDRSIDWPQVLALAGAACGAGGDPNRHGPVPAQRRPDRIARDTDGDRLREKTILQLLPSAGADAACEKNPVRTYCD